MKKAIIIIVSLLVILGGIFTILLCFTPVFDFLKPASEKFSVQAKKLLGSKEEVSYEDYISSIKSLKEEQESYVEDLKISMNVSVPSKIIDSKTQKILNSSSIELKQSYDKDSKAMSNDISLLYNKKETINLNTVVDGKKISVGSKGLYDKTLTFDLEKIKDFCKNNDIPASDEDLKQIEEVVGKLGTNKDNSNANLVYDLMYLTEDEYKAINKNYGDVLTKVIDKKKYSLKTHQKVSVGGKEVKVNAYTLTLSGEDVYNAIIKLAETARDDDNLKGLLVKKINLIKDYVVKINSASSASSATSKKAAIKSDYNENIKESDIEKMFDEIIEALSESEEEFSKLDGVVKITIYSDKKTKNPVRVDIAIADDKKDAGAVIFTEEIESNKTTYTLDVGKVAKKFVGGSSGFGTSAKLVIVDEYEKTNTSRKGTITASARVAGFKKDIAVIEYENVKSKSEMKKNIKIKSDELPELNFEIKFEATGLDKDKGNVVFDIDVNVPYDEDTYKFAMNVEASIETGKSDIPKIDKSNSVDVFSKSQEELTELSKEILTKAADTLPAKLAIYGVKITKQDILKLIPEEPAAPEEPAIPEVPEVPEINTEEIMPAA